MQRIVRIFHRTHIDHRHVQCLRSDHVDGEKPGRHAQERDVAMGTFPGTVPVTVHEPYLFQIKNPHSRAQGKLLLSMADDDLVNSYLSEPLERLTPNTITSVPDLQREFEQIRRDGYAIEFEESAEGKCAVSVPCGGFSLPFCVTIVVPTDRYVGDPDHYLEALQEIVATHHLRDDLKLQVD